MANSSSRDTRTLITLVLPADSPLPTVGARWDWNSQGVLVARDSPTWHRRADGKIEAIYTREELELALAILGEDVCLECLGRPPCHGCRERPIRHERD